MERIYGYCRISTSKQNIDRQVRNILSAYPNAKIYKERFTGTKIQGRAVFEKIITEIQNGDILVCDSVSRFSRSADEGVDLYMKLYERGVSLVFLKEPHINTSTYDSALKNADSIKATGNVIADEFLKTTARVLKLLAAQQIRMAFDQSQKEIDDLHQRTKEGIETARRNGKQIGTPKNAVLNVKKKAPAISIIQKHSKRFGGELNDVQCAKIANISTPTFYKYCAEIAQANKDTLKRS